MPRFLLIIVFIFVRVGKALVTLKNELVTGSLYFGLLAPIAFVSKFIPIRKYHFQAKRSTWVEIDNGEDM